MRLIRSDAFDFFKSRGVPPSVLTASFPEQIERHISHIEIPKNEGTTLFDRKKQLLALNQFERQLGSKSTSKPFLFIGGRSYDYIPLQFALNIVSDLVQKQGKEFYWHSVYGNPTDELRDNKEMFNKIKGSSLLVLSNIAVNSTAMKIEKVRDLLNMYSSIPRIVCVGGMDPNQKIDPVSWTKHNLHVKPDYFLYC